MNKQTAELDGHLTGQNATSIPGGPMSTLDGVRRSHWIVIATVFFFFALIAGCGSSSNSGITKQPTTPSPTPVPSPTSPPSPTPPPSASSTMVYVRTGTGGVAGYTLKADGTLSALAGSPFAVPGTAVAASGNQLFVTNGSQVLSYAIDRQTGALTAESQAAVAGAGPVTAIGNSVYVTGSDSSSNNWVVDSFSVGVNGALTPIGSPVVVAGSCQLCVTPADITADAKFVVVGLGDGEHGAGSLAILTRQADGSVIMSGTAGADSMLSPSIDAMDRTVYAVDAGPQYILVTATTGQALQQFYPQSGTFNGVAADRAGKFVVGTLTPNALITYAVNSAGTIGGQVSTVPAADTTLVPVFDKSGQFVVVEESGGLETFKFDPGSGALTHVQTTTVANPGVPVMATP